MLDKVNTNPNICSVELAFQGNLIPSKIAGWQPFHNSMMQDTDFEQTHIGLGSVSFAEESQETAGGTSYKQMVVIRFATTDKNRSERIALMDKVLFVKLKLTNGLDIVVGRNDVAQNSRPRIKVKTNVKTAEVEFETVSIFPVGFVVNPDSFGLPLIPINTI